MSFLSAHTKIDSELREGLEMKGSDVCEAMSQKRWAADLLSKNSLLIPLICKLNTPEHSCEAVKLRFSVRKIGSLGPSGRNHRQPQECSFLLLLLLLILFLCPLGDALLFQSRRYLLAITTHLPPRLSLETLATCNFIIIFSHL